MTWLVGHASELLNWGAWLFAWASVVRHINKRQMKVLVVIDGDTFDMLDRKGRRHRVRLQGVDCPEIGQPFGMEVRATVDAWLKGKWVTLRLTGRDKYRRRLAHIWLPDGSLLSRRLLWQGLAHPLPGTWSIGAWVARLRRRGIWSAFFVAKPWASATRKRGLFGWWARKKARALLRPSRR